MKRIAIVPGSFDPITYGHVDVIRRASELYDEVVVAVMINHAKSYLFTMEQRERLVRIATSSMDRVRVLSSDGMLWKLAEDLGACAIVKGYRNETDYAYEMEMADYNRAHNPNAETVLLRADEKLSEVSSSVVREALKNGTDLSAYLPLTVSEEIAQILSRDEK